MKRHDEQTNATGGLAVGSEVRTPSYANLAHNLAQYGKIGAQHQYRTVIQEPKRPEGHSKPVGGNAPDAAGFGPGNWPYSCYPQSGYELVVGVQSGQQHGFPYGYGLSMPYWGPSARDVAFLGLRKPWGTVGLP